MTREKIISRKEREKSDLPVGDKNEEEGGGQKEAQFDIRVKEAQFEREHGRRTSFYSET